MNKPLIFILMCALACSSASAVVLSQVRFHDEASDTVKINDILVQVGEMRLPSGGKTVAEVGSRFLGTPYVGHTLEGDPEMLTVNVDELDCTTFVETVAALSLTLQERRNSWRDFIYNLERIRYRSGTMAGYPSRLHYISDWAADNMHRGVITDVTTRFPKYNYLVRTLDFMTENADKYQALADSANLAGIKAVEIGYRGYRFPYIKSGDLANKDVKADFRDGDIVGLVTNIKNLDIAHMGIIVKRDGEPYLMHASSSEGKVVVSALPLADFMKKNRQFLGLRVFRLAE